MAFRHVPPLLEDEFLMVIRSKVSPPPVVPVAPGHKQAVDVYHPGDAIPVPDVIEKDSGLGRPVHEV